MKKTSTLLTALLITVCGYTQQTFTNFENASMVIGQPTFLTQIVNTSDSITRGPAYCAISSKGMLAVAEQAGNSVKIWHTLPTRNGQPCDVRITLPFYAEGVDWTPDGNKLIVAGGSSNIYIWNSIPTVNNQPVDVTINQYTRSPQGVLVTPNGKLLITERYANRILVWNSVPSVNNTPANYVIGQPNMTTYTSGNSAGKMNQPWGLDLSPDNKLLVADEQNHRVLIFDSVPVSNGENATAVIGQTGFGMSGSGTSATRINTPVGVTVTVDGKVAVSEFGNHRVTIWDSVPETNGQAATVVLGQPNFTSKVAFYPSGNAAANNMRYVYTISSDLNGRLFLCGRDMNRVMVFGDLPTDTAELSVTISQSSAALCDSSNVVYKIKINNPGPDTAEYVVSTTAFPTGYTIDNITVLDGSYNQESGYWSIPAIAPNDSALLIIDGLVNAGMAGRTITTYANIINSNAIDTNLNNNGTSVSVTILAIAKPADPIANDTETCYGSSASLSAFGTGTLYWYNNADDMTPLGTGSVYNTIPLISNSTFYVEANNGCPSNGRARVEISINPVFNQSETATICSGNNYTFPDGSTQSNITATTIHTSNLLTLNGCDSVIVTTVYVNPVYNLSESAFICNGDSYTFPDGTTQSNITGNVTHISNLSTYLGCDSVIVTSIHVNPVYNLSESAFICNGDSYTFPDGTTQSNITGNVTHISNLSTYLGCDSVIVTTVYLNPVYNLTESAFICIGDSYTFPDGTTQSNITGNVTHISNLSTYLGCDSVIVTTVYLNPVYNLTESAFICNGDSYTFPDGTTQSNITGSVTHTSNLSTYLGCDSVIVTSVHVNPVYNLTESAFICNGDSYTFPDGTTQSNITGTTIHTSNLSTYLGCDSVIVTTVNVNPVYNLTESATVCSGESYTFPDGTTQSNITGTTMHTSNLLTILGCDSVIVTTVNVNPVYNFTESATVCSGESYTFPDGTTQNNITDTLVYSSAFVSKDGCDSLIVTTVYVNATFNFSETIALCNGDSYIFPDGSAQQNIVADMSHTSNLVSIAGCDSIIVTNIEVTTINTTVIQDGAVLTAEASGLEYQWVSCNDNYSVIAGETDQTLNISENGNYAVIISENGCSDTSSCYEVNLDGLVDNLEDIRLNVYPNPTQGNVTIDLKENYGDISVEIFNLSGQYLVKNIFEASKSVQVEMNDFKPGIYIMKINIAEKNTVVRIVKE